jgi:UDP-N-acetylmuramate dehydrogenase
MITAPFDFAVNDYPLAPASLYNVGGNADLALMPRTLEEVEAAYAWLGKQDVPKLVLGGGSNVLIADAGFRGIVLFTTELTGLEDLGDDRFRVEGGMILNEMLEQTILKHNYDGAGGLTGIPGTVGGAIFMNAGTVNGSICQLMESVQITTESGTEEIVIDPSMYSYRGQTFCPPSGLIVSGTFQFTHTEVDQRAIYDRYIARRKETQPQGNSCGSVFKNPEGNHSGQLIESCGLKGTRRGGAAISDVHANFIVNDRNASSDDILGLIRLCKETVLEKHGVELHEEVKIYGVDAG